LSWRLKRIRCVRSGSVIAVDSVISATIICGSTPAAIRLEEIFSTRSGCQSWRGERLKPISSSSPAARHSLSWRPISSTTQSPIASIRPISSASGMKSFGGTSPPFGSCQRINASTPTVRASLRSTSGW